MDIGAKIKELREKSGLSQAELGRRSNCTGAAISWIEKGNRVPTIKTLEAVAFALNVEPGELTGAVKKFQILSKDKEQFFRDWGDIEKLSDVDKHLIMALLIRIRKDYLVKEVE